MFDTISRRQYLSHADENWQNFLDRGAGARAAASGAARGACVCARAAGPGAASRAPLGAAVTAAAVQLVAALPAGAEGKLFDFNATLPVMIGQFLILMVLLDKTWFSPVGKVLDDRDAKIRALLAGVQDNSSELTKLEEEGKTLLADARSAASELMEAAKSKAEASTAEELTLLKTKQASEMSALMAQLETDREQAQKDLEPKVQELAGEILAKLA